MCFVVNVFFQVRVRSSKLFKVLTVEDDEERLQELDRFSVWGWFQSWLRERHNETSININLFSKKTCFRIDPADGAQYTVELVRSKCYPVILFQWLILMMPKMISLFCRV